MQPDNMTTIRCVRRYLALVDGGILLKLVRPHAACNVFDQTHSNHSMSTACLNLSCAGALQKVEANMAEVKESSAESVMSILKTLKR